MRNTQVSINFFLQTPCRLDNKKLLKETITVLLNSEKPNHYWDINVIFCSKDYLLTLNKTYLDHNFETDILTFELTASKKTTVAELYISVEAIRENARINKVLRKEELYRVIFHGTLHLCNYNDKLPEEINIMRKKEDKYLKLMQSKVYKK